MAHDVKLERLGSLCNTFSKESSQYSASKNPKLIKDSTGPAISEMNNCLESYGYMIDALKGLYVATDNYLTTTYNNLLEVEEQNSKLGS